MKYRIVTFICFTEHSILSYLVIVQKNIKGGNALNCMVILLFSDTIFKRKIENSIVSSNMPYLLSSFGGPI